MFLILSYFYNSITWSVVSSPPHCVFTLYLYSLAHAGWVVIWDHCVQLCLGTDGWVGVTVSESLLLLLSFPLALEEKSQMEIIPFSLFSLPITFFVFYLWFVMWLGMILYQTSFSLSLVKVLSSLLPFSNTMRQKNSAPISFSHLHMKNAFYPLNSVGIFLSVLKHENKHWYRYFMWDSVACSSKPFFFF